MFCLLIVCSPMLEENKVSIYLSTQYKVKDLKITTSTKVIEPKVKSSKSQSGSQSSQSSSNSQSSSQSQSNSQPSSSAQSQPRSNLFYLSQEEEDKDQPRDIVQSGIKKMKNPPTKQINQTQLKHKIDSTAWTVVWILVRLKIFFT